MENNDNLNNQVSESNIVQQEMISHTNLVDNSNQQVVKDNQALIDNTPKKSNGGSIVLLLLIIVGVGGYFLYTRFMPKMNQKEMINQLQHQL